MNINDTVSKELQKLSDYEGNVTPYIKPPIDFTKWRYGARKLLKIWYRIDNHKLYWKPLVETLKQVTSYFIDLGKTKYAKDLFIDMISSNLYASTLNDFLKKSYEMSTELHEEAMRVRTKVNEVNCSICSTPLCNPAYIVYRDGKGHMKNRSKPIGIMCLNSSLSRLQKLISTKEFQQILVDLNNSVKEEE
jgi:hypothetical protein